MYMCLCSWYHYHVVLLGVTADVIGVVGERRQEERGRRGRGGRRSVVPPKKTNAMIMQSTLADAFSNRTVIGQRDLNIRLNLRLNCS